jgi:ribosomal protein S18 acetylase RimI-like enzyme
MNINNTPFTHSRDEGPTVTTQQLTVTTRPTEGHDLAFLRELFTSTRDELEVLSSDVRYLLIDMQFRAQRRHFATTYPNARHEILEVEGVEVGRLVVDESGPSVRIVDITVRRGRRGHGIATAVVNDLIVSAEADNRSVEVVLWTGNTSARHTFRGFGFEVLANEGGYLTMVRTARLAA